MTADLAVIDPGAALEAAADPGEFVVQCLTRGKSWLAEALEHNDLEALVNVKGWAATLRTATMQKQLGKDAELAATELVRRAERYIGLGIRAGQEAGEIATRGYSGPQLRPFDRVRNGELETVQPGLAAERTELPRPSDYVSGSQEIVDVYALAAAVEDQFEEALTEAKDEGNLSRANVVRLVKGKPAPKPDRHQVHYRGRRIDPHRIADESIAMLDGIASSLALIEDVPSLDAEKRLAWLDAIREPLRVINRFTKELRG